VPWPHLRCGCGSLERVSRVDVIADALGRLGVSAATTPVARLCLLADRPKFCQFAIELFDTTRPMLPYRNRNADMSEKKRKRQEQNGERPKKKTAVAPTGNVRVKMVENKETLGPLLGMIALLEAVAWRQNPSQMTENLGISRNYVF